VRWNAADRYADLSADLPRRLEQLAQAGGLSTRLAAPKQDLAALAEEAGGQWTGRFNPRPFDAAAALEIYQCAS